MLLVENYNDSDKTPSANNHHVYCTFVQIIGKLLLTQLSNDSFFVIVYMCILMKQRRKAIKNGTQWAKQLLNILMLSLHSIIMLSVKTFTYRHKGELFCHC